MVLQRLRKRYQSYLSRLGSTLVHRGVPPAWLGYRWVQKETLQEYVERKGRSSERVRYEIVHPEVVVTNPLPRNVVSREELPKDRGWWRYSFWDVPARTSGATVVATLPDCQVVPYIDPQDRFWVGILNDEGRALDIHEYHFRTGHAGVMRSSTQPVKLQRATWVLERVYDNYSHWFTAHLPKFLLLKSRGTLGDVLLPPERPKFVDDSLRMAGMEPEGFRTFDPWRPLEVQELTVLDTDRFRPELLRLVREACPIPSPDQPDRRVYISRAKAARRQLLNEEDIWPMLEEAGFERMFMEDLSFEEQVRLMRETAILFAPHGAGLTNMMFCPPGTHIVEIADLSFPNPNFYAVASAMGHAYWLLSAEGVGDVHPLEKDLRIAPSAIEDVLARLPL